MGTKATNLQIQDEAERIDWLVGELHRLYPDVECELNHRNPYELLAATILSAQCTDVRVNMVTPRLFDRYPTPHVLAQAKQEDVEEIVKSTGFYRNKAKNLIGMAAGLVERHGGEVPRTMDELLALPGVARKTANVVLGTAYGIAVGVVVDTHVARLSNRLGLTVQSDPKKIEQELMAKVPQSEWIHFSHMIIWHGRRVCDARRPKCDACSLAPNCPSFGIFPSGSLRRTGGKKSVDATL